VERLPSDDTVQLTVSDVVYRGLGLARLEGRVVFVRHALAGETVRAEIVKKRKRYWEARLLEVLQSSGERIQPACELWRRCPGCCYQHAAYGLEVQLKQTQFIDHLGRTAGVDGSVFLEPVPSPVELGYRNKIGLHAAVVGRKVRLGYIAEDNRTVFDVPVCLLAQDAINGELEKLRRDGAFMGRLRDGMLVTMRYTERDGVVCRIGRGEGGAAVGAAAAPSESGERVLSEQTRMGLVRAPLTSFFQANLKVTDLMLTRVTELIREAAPRLVIDLYCGVGIFALAAAAGGVERVLGVDRDATAVGAAKHNARERKLDGATFMTASAVRGLRSAADRFDPTVSAVVLDPPRRGLDREVIQEISRFRPAQLVYVSCAADTLARDVKVLRSFGYQVQSAQLFDMFPRTAYFESITHLVC
jgi:tRNA/tmRNA/rRNA uracil-C5-methylase (TrmA/RlmC/RlmD family)